MNTFLTCFHHQHSHRDQALRGKVERQQREAEALQRRTEDDGDDHESRRVYYELPRLIDLGPPGALDAKNHSLWWNSVLEEENGEVDESGVRVSPDEPTFPFYRREGEVCDGGRKKEKRHHASPTILEKTTGRERSQKFSQGQRTNPISKSNALLRGGGTIDNIHPYHDCPNAYERHGPSSPRLKAFASRDALRPSLIEEVVNTEIQGTHLRKYPVTRRTYTVHNESELAHWLHENPHRLPRTQSPGDAPTPHSFEYIEANSLPTNRDEIGEQSAVVADNFEIPSHYPEPSVHTGSSPPTHIPNSNQILNTPPIPDSFTNRSNSPCPISHQHPSRTWNSTLNEILTHESVAEEREILRQRANNTSGQNGRSRDGVLSAPHVGLTPNFSYPVAAAAWYDIEQRDVEMGDVPSQECLENAYRASSPQSEDSLYRLTPVPKGKFVSSQTRTLDADSTGAEHEECRKWPPTHAHPNGIQNIRYSPETGLFHRIDSAVSRPSSPYSDQIHARPSGLATSADLEECYLLSDPSPPASPNTRLQLKDGTIATQAKTIKILHHTLDRLREASASSGEESELISALSGAISDCNWRNEVLKRMVSELEEENEELWKTMEFSKQVLRDAGDRENELWNMAYKCRYSKPRTKRFNLVARILSLFSCLPLEPRACGCRPPRFYPDAPAICAKHRRAQQKPRSNWGKRQFNPYDLSDDDESVSNSLFGKDMDHIVKVAEQNCITLEGDLVELSDLVDHCEALMLARVREERGAKPEMVCDIRDV